MRIKFIQVNIYKGRYLNSLLDFLKSEKPDIVSCQEVTAGEVNLCQDKSANLFETIKNELGFDGVYHADLNFSDMPAARFGNAVFSRFPILDKKVVVLKDFRPITYDELEGDTAYDIRPKIPRHLLDAVLDLGKLKIHAMSWHGAWTAPPVDTEETLRQSKLVASYISSLEEPFILGCDANNILGNETIGLINKAANNLMIGQNIAQTTHPKVHKIVPRGFLVDFIFCSKDFQLKSLSAAQILVSDHLPVVANLEI